MIIIKENYADDPQLSFDELDSGFWTKEAIAEARRCLNCPRPLCRKGCPIDNDIPGFIHALSLGNIGQAREIIAERSNLPAICGRVCPHEKQCEASCVLAQKQQGIKIGKLERFIADFEAEMDLHKTISMTGNLGKVAIIGSGPAGLTVAGDLITKGFEVVVYEAESEPGGILMHGIPEFRLPQDVVRREILRISEMGVRFQNNCVVGIDVTVDQLFNQGFDAIFIGTGTALAKELDLPEKDLIGVVQSTYLLRTVTLYNQGKLDRKEIPVNPDNKVIVIGAGNVAMDAARTALRVGASHVTVIHRRTEAEITALRSEYEETVAEGVQFQWMTEPVSYVGKNGRVVGMKVNTPEGCTFLEADCILLAASLYYAD